MTLREATYKPVRCARHMATRHHSRTHARWRRPLRHGLLFGPPHTIPRFGTLSRGYASRREGWELRGATNEGGERRARGGVEGSSRGSHHPAHPSRAGVEV
eukprot:6177695-Pleurochrysis_carterae.AAC.1